MAVLNDHSDAASAKSNIDLFPRTDKVNKCIGHIPANGKRPKKYARLIPLHWKNTKHISDINLMLSFQVARGNKSK